jgi:hypothetical protein
MPGKPVSPLVSTSNRPFFSANFAPEFAATDAIGVVAASNNTTSSAGAADADNSSAAKRRVAFIV